MYDSIHLDVHNDIHNALIASVKKVKASNAFANDEWLNFCNKNAPYDSYQRNVTLDPKKYSACFLGDFLQLLSVQCTNVTAIDDFVDRSHKCIKVYREGRTAASFGSSSTPVIEKLWIVVGESVLRGATDLQCESRSVALPGDLIHHSGPAVAQLLNCLASGLVENPRAPCEISCSRDFLGLRPRMLLLVTGCDRGLRFCVNM